MNLEHKQHVPECVGSLRHINETREIVSNKGVDHRALVDYMRAVLGLKQVQQVELKKQIK